MIRSFLVGLLLTPITLLAQVSPEVSSWILNPTHETGYQGLETNVQKVQYSEANVYIACTCIPGYDIGPWTGNPNAPANQNFVFKLTRTPQQNSGAPTATPLGHIGVWRNGVSVFNAKDARSYQNKGVWNQNAIIVEGSSFDDCLGHPAPNGEYHHHLNPICLYDQHDSTKHSPIIGYAFDGYPIYGAYGFADASMPSTITRMRSSYRLRSITSRTDGPAISQQYPLGYYIEDYEYVQGLGDLDEHNGRICVTPEYPKGAYAYFVTIDEQGTAAYPYTLGPTYYGTVPAGNTGPQSGHNTVSEQVAEYTGTAGVESTPMNSTVAAYPNPASLYLKLPDHGIGTSFTITNAVGQTVLEALYTGSIDVSSLPRGSYSIGTSEANYRFVKP